MPGPFIVQLGERPSPFNPSERLAAFVGDGHIVQHIALAMAFKTQAKAQDVAVRFDLGEVLDTGGLMVQRLDTLTIMACATPADMMAHLDAPAAVRKQNQQRWIRAVRTPDDRCPAGASPTHMPLWRLCGDKTP